MSKPIRDREEAIKVIEKLTPEDVRYRPPLTGREVAERIVDALGIGQPDSCDNHPDRQATSIGEKLCGECYAEWAQSNRPQPDPEVERLRKLTGSLTQTVKDLCGYVQEAVGDESVLMPLGILKQFGESEAHKLRLELGEFRERAEWAEERLRAVRQSAEAIFRVEREIEAILRAVLSEREGDDG